MRVVKTCLVSPINFPRLVNKILSYIEFSMFNIGFVMHDLIQLDAFSAIINLKNIIIKICLYMYTVFIICVSIV